MPVLKALIDKSRTIMNLDMHVPDLPPTSSGPIFFEEFQMYSCSKQWIKFIDKKVSDSKKCIFLTVWYFLDLL